MSRELMIVLCDMDVARNVLASFLQDRLIVECAELIIERFKCFELC